jgi:Zn-dependent protease
MTWYLGTIAGIAVRMHATFLLLLVFVAWQHWLLGRNLAAVLDGVGFILVLFGCVVLHELGHALTARRFGVVTRDITLLPIGGVARLERMPEQPIHELWVSLAGPAVNVLIALALYATLASTTGLAPLGEIDVARGPFLERLMLVNLVLAGFNLLPAFPMDGGRAVRALLAMRLEYTRATQIAAALGQSMAFAFGLLGLLVNPLLLFIALFVWIGAGQEATAVQVDAALAGTPVRRAMITDFQALDVEDRLDRVVDLLLSGSQQDFPVLSAGRAVGVVVGRELAAALRQHGTGGRVGDVMRRDPAVIDSHDMLDAAFARLRACGAAVGLVEHGGRLVGLLTLDNVGEFLMVRSSLAEHRRSRPGD